MSRDRWFAAILLVQCDVESEDGVEPLVDHSVRLLKASDSESAYERALTLGASEATSYPNEDGESVTWSFAGLEDLCELDERPGDGTEVLSWLARGKAIPVDKAELTCFWAEANRDRLVEDLLD